MALGNLELPMITTLLLIVSAWMLVLWLATGLCAAARLGDRTQVDDTPVAAARARGWEQTGALAISVRAGHGAEPDTSLAGAGSLAA